MRREGLSGELWPAHVKPKSDEILSSWLVRLTMAHGLKLHTFCSIIWPGKQIWTRDVDKSTDSEIVQVLSYKTGTPFDRVRATTLAAYEGVLYERHNHYGPTAWIMPVGVYHRTRRQFGLQYCSRCLAEDKVSYYRRRWRLAFMVVCETHSIMLRDRCPQCQAAVNFHRDELGNHKKIVATSLTLCHSCGFDLREEKLTPAMKPITPAEVNFTKRLLGAMNSGYMKISESVITYSHLYFTALRQIMKVLAVQNDRVGKLRTAIIDAYGLDNYASSTKCISCDVQELSIELRRQLLGIARCLLDEWPLRFIEFSRKCGIWSSLWLRNLEPNARERSRLAPFWFWSPVHDHLYRSKYQPSEEETKAAIRYLNRKGEALNKSTLSRLLGVAVIRREITL